MDRKQISPKTEPTILYELQNEQDHQHAQNSSRGHTPHTEERAPATPESDVHIEEVDAPIFMDQNKDCSSCVHDDARVLRLEREKELALEKQALEHDLALAASTLGHRRTKIGKIESEIVVGDLLRRIDKLNRRNAELSEDLQLSDRMNDNVFRTVERALRG